MVSCILLAAGFSRRFGSPKALALINGVTVIEQLQNILIHSQVGEIVVVLGDHADDIKSHILNHKKIRVVYNKDYNLGQTSSFKVGLEAISTEALGVMLLPVDVPTIKVDTIDFLVDQFLLKRPSTLIPTYYNKKGHPPIFNAIIKKALLDMDNTKGLNSFERQHELDIVLLPVEDAGVLRSFNTPEELEKIKAYLG